MKTNHLSDWQQEEYLLDQDLFAQGSPQMLRHLAECSECRDSIAHLERTIGLFRTTAVEYSALSLAGRPRQTFPGRQAPLAAFRWAFAALVPLLLLVLAMMPMHLSPPKVVPTNAPMSDDALLEQVDEQLSVAVPSSMESLTHLVTTESGNGERSKPIVQSY